MPFVDPRSLMYQPSCQITAAWRREMLPSLIGRSALLVPRPMMNSSLFTGNFCPLKITYSCGLVMFDRGPALAVGRGGGAAGAGYGWGAAGAAGACAGGRWVGGGGG